MARLEYRLLDEARGYPVLFFYDRIDKDEVSLRFACDYLVKGHVVYEKTSCAVEPECYVIYVKRSTEEQALDYAHTASARWGSIQMELREYREGTAIYPLVHTYYFKDDDDALLHLQARGKQEMTMMPYLQKRERLYGPMREEGVFTWDRIYGEEYALADAHRITRAFRQEVAEATDRLGAIFARVLPVLQQAEDSLLCELGVPAQALQAVRTAVSRKLPTVIGRFDFAETAEGIKMLEFNSDTPTGIVEAFYANGPACRFFGMQDPNEGMDAQIAPAFAQLLAAYRRQGWRSEHIWFSSLDWHEEDCGTTLYLNGSPRSRSCPKFRMASYP